MIGFKSVSLDFLVLYKSNFPQALMTIFETNEGWIDIMILTLISFLYYLTETTLNAGIGATIFGKYIISRYERGRKEQNKLILLGSQLSDSSFWNSLIFSLFSGILGVSRPHLTIWPDFILSRGHIK
jgi:hypothetical protein